MIDVSGQEKVPDRPKNISALCLMVHANEPGSQFPDWPIWEINSWDLFDWARTGDEDIDEPLRALLPVRAGRHVGDADKRPK
jgi:hypothetical protein